jgi:hypothetical protein
MVPANRLNSIEKADWVPVVSAMFSGPMFHSYRSLSAVARLSLKARSPRPGEYRHSVVAEAFPGVSCPLNHFWNLGRASASEHDHLGVGEPFGQVIHQLDNP